MQNTAATKNANIWPFKGKYFNFYKNEGIFRNYVFTLSTPQPVSGPYITV